MKYWTKILSVFLFFSFIFLSKNIEAKSGCCSSHGGVNCAAGPQSNGHVVCNDGSRNSSCLYSEMVMCGGNSTTTTTTVKTVTQPTSTPRPTSTPKPTATPTTKPTPTPTKTPTNTSTQTPTPTLVLTITPTLSPTETPANSPVPEEPSQIEEVSPTIQPQVLGESDTNDKPIEPIKTSDTILGFSFLGLIGFGIYKLFVKTKNKIKNYFNKK